MSRQELETENSRLKLQLSLTIDDFKEKAIMFEKQRQRLVKLEKIATGICACFDLHDYPELEARPYIRDLGELLPYGFHGAMSSASEQDGPSA